MKINRWIQIHLTFKKYKDWGSHYMFDIFLILEADVVEYISDIGGSYNRKFVMKTAYNTTLIIR